MDSEFTQNIAVVSVIDEKVGFSAAKLVAFKDGLEVPIPIGILNPNKGFNRYSQFMESINFVLNYEFPVNQTLSTVAKKLSYLCEVDEEKNKKIRFICRQIELLSGKKYIMKDYCFAIEHYPSCKYDQMRQFLKFPCKRTVQSIISTTDKSFVLNGVFEKVSEHQKKCLLIVDEMKIRPSVSFSGGCLNGYATNDSTAKATSVLGIMLKCMQRGPSVMLSLIPVHKLTADYQFQVVVEMARAVEQSGGKVIGSVTDNHKLNQRYCSLFVKKKTILKHSTP